jgi:hypothetical protein
MFEYSIGDIVILNEKVARDLPMRVGQRGVIIRRSTFNSFEFDVECDDGDVLPLKSSEVNKLTTEDKRYMDYIFINNQVMFDDKKVMINRVNYLTQQADIFDDIGVFSIAEFKDLEPIHINSFVEVPSSNSETYKKLLQEKHDVYVRKNADYGNSFEDQFNEYGLLSAIIRLDDKLRRLKQLRNSEAKVKDESIRDTALDLANYADMLVMALDKSK